MKPSGITFIGLAKIVVVGIGLFIAWKGLSIIIVLSIAAMIAMALYPIAKKINKKLPWIFSVLLVVLLLLIPVLGIIILTTFAFVNELPQVITSINELIASLPFVPEILRFQDGSIIETLQNNAGYFWDSTKMVIGGVASIITVIVAVFYLLYDHVGISKVLLTLVSHKNESSLFNLFEDLSLVVGNYIRGSLMVAAIAASVSFVGLTLLGVPFALPLAIFTGIMGLLPFVGPFIGFVPSAILGLAQGPLIGLGVVILYAVYQQLENSFIVPMMYTKTMDLSPALVFLSVIIGAGTFGVIGAFLALPIAASIPVFIKYKKVIREEVGA